MAFADAYPNYSIYGIPFFVSGETPRAAMLAHRTSGETEAAGITFRPHHRATRIDFSARLVTFETIESVAAIESAGYKLETPTGDNPHE